jgi:hypothetical protein
VLSHVLFNTVKPNKDLLAKYENDKEYGVTVDKDKLKTKHYKAVGKDLLSKELPMHIKGDKIAKTRSFIRHDSDVLARQIMKIYFS